MKPRHKKPKKPRGLYRSGMEERLVPPLLARGAQYEPLFLEYEAPKKKYLPDVVLPNGIAIEIKGYFTSADRSKMLLVKKALPGLDLRMVLASPQKKLNKQSKTTEAAWCEQYGIPWAHNNVPEEWLAEPTNLASWTILSAAPRRKQAGRKQAA